MASLNRVQIIGNLGRDPEVRSFSNGGKIVNLRVACAESWRDRETGERKERTEWINVSISNEGLAKVAEQYLRKGSRVFIEGQLETRKWQDQSGQDRYSTEVAVRPYKGSLLLLDRREGGGGRADDDDEAPAPRARASNAAKTHGGIGSEMDDEIPF